MSKYIFILIFLISLIYAQELNLTINNTNNTNSNDTKKPRIKFIDEDSDEEFNMTIDEMDKMIFCTFVMEQKMEKYSKELKELSKKFKINETEKEMPYNKVSTEVFQKCTRRIDIKTVNYYVKNLTILNDFQWEKKFDKMTNINFNDYTSIDDLEYTLEQQTMLYKFKKVEKLFQQKVKDNREKYMKESQKIKIGNYDFENIPKGFMLVITLVIFMIFFGTIFFYLKKLKKKKESNKKKKKKTQ